MNTRVLGQQKEQIAEEFLTRSGYRILERNFRCRTGEIDRIAVEGGYLVFVEIRYRRNGVDPAKESVNTAKQKRICRACDYYRAIHQLAWDTPIRFDVVSLSDSQIELIKNAFPYVQGSGKKRKW